MPRPPPIAHRRCTLISTWHFVCLHTYAILQDFCTISSARLRRDGPKIWCSLRSFFSCTRGAHNPSILTRSNSRIEMICHRNHARKYWHVALLPTGFADTFIDPFRTTTSAQSSTEPEFIARDTQESAGTELIGIHLHSRQTIGIHCSDARYSKLPSRSRPSFLKPSGPSI